MPVSEVKYFVTAPSGMIWGSRFNTPEAAWNRIRTLVRLPDTKKALDGLKKTGWKVTRQ